MQPVTDQLPAKRPNGVEGRSKPKRVTAKLKKAIDAMVWECGTDYQKAAAAAGLTAYQVREALKKPHVKQYYLAELDVLATSERARNIHAAADVRDQRDNQTARMQGVKWLDERAAEGRQGTSHRNPTPGVQIVIHAERDGRMKIDDSVIEINPVGESVESETE